MSESDWFSDARFGIFIHWDHASQQGLEISWPLVGGIFALPEGQRVGVEQYNSSAATFDPTEWDPVAVARLAKAAGAGYVVFTAKHHSGFAMYDTALSDWSVVKASPHGKDLLRPLVGALRDEGIRVGVYFSLSDWHEPTYPAFADEHKPYLFGLSPPYPGDESWERYLTYLKGQLEEVLTGYGPIDVLWFDGGWERPADRWRPQELEEHIRSFQPHVLINDRLLGVGDYTTPEQFVPPAPPGGRWETCMTMNESWGYNPDDPYYKTPRTLVHTLCEIAGRGGNFLLNISPTGTGAIPDEQVARLDEVGRWMALHGESVRGTEPGLEPWQFYGPSTRRSVGEGAGERVYLFVLARPYEAVTVRGVPIKRVTGATVLGTGQSLKYRGRTTLLDHFNSDPLGELRIEIPESALDPSATVIALDLAASPEA